MSMTSSPTSITRFQRFELQMISMPLMIICASHATMQATQPASTQPSSPPSTQPDLSGPKVADDQPAKPTIVHKSFNGDLEDIGPEPDIAAILALDLTKEQREAFETTLAERHAAFDKAVRDNYSLIVELGTIQGEPDERKRIDVINRTRFAFEPFFKRGMFVDEFGDHLTMPQREQINAMLFEYREAKIFDMQRNHGLTRPQAAFRARLEAFGQLVKQSIERQVSLERESFEQISTELNLTEEQKAKAQAIFGPLTIKRLQNIEITSKERSEAFRTFNKELTAEQRGKLLAILIKQWLPPTSPTSPTPSANSQPQSQPATQEN
jgi:hypothetical protein